MSVAASRGLVARRLIAQATGPSAVTIWTWLVTAPIALTVMSGLQYVTGGPGAVIAVAALTHAALGVLLAVLRLLLLVVPAPARAAAVLAGFAVLGVLRPLLFLWSGAVLHIPVAAGDLGGRILINLVTTVAMFSLIAVAVQLVRDHAAVYRRLRSAQEASARDAERATERVERMRHSAVDAVLDQLEQATSGAAAEGIHPSAAATLLRALAEEVVRPASHRVYDEDFAGLDDAPDVRPVPRREWIASVFGAMQAAPPLPLAVLFVILVLPFGLWEYGLVFMMLPLVCGFAVLVAGNTAMVPLVRSAPGVLRVVVLLVGYGLVGALLSATSEVVVRLLGGDPHLVWFEAATYWVVGFAVAFVASLTARVRRDQSELEEAIQVNIRAAAATRSALEHERADLARLLHAGVQSELIAAALSLASGPGEDASAELREVVGKIRAELSAPRAEPDAADRIAALVESWGSAIPLRSSIGDVWERLREPGRAEAVVDAISEGLANAVRHGDGTPVTLEVRPATAEGVSVRVVSGGALSSTRPGIGLRQLAERGEVALRESAGRVELAVAIP